MAVVAGIGRRIDIFLHLRYNIEVRHVLDGRAAMVELADTKDLKSFGSDSVPVRPRLAAPGRSSFAPALFFLSGYRACAMPKNRMDFSVGLQVHPDKKD